MDNQQASQNRTFAQKITTLAHSRTSTQKSLWGYILSDLDRYRVIDKRSYVAMFILCPGAIAGLIYRIGHWLWSYQGVLSPVVRILYAFYILIKRFGEIITGITIHPQAKIGTGLYIGHGGSVIIGGSAVLGNHCNISHEVTIGVAGRGDKRGTPKIGDRIYIGAGAKLFGAIEIGNDVAIGANAVVTKSLSDRAVAVGIPVRVISYEGSFEYVLYRNMESDPTRQASFLLKDMSKDSEMLLY